MDNLLVLSIISLVTSYLQKTEEIIKLDNVSLMFKKQIAYFALEYLEFTDHLYDVDITYNKDILMQMKNNLETSLTDLDDFIKDVKGTKRLFS